MDSNQSITDCPKCGFSQPKDRYCASCGLDIYNYHPAAQSIPKRLLNMPGFYIILVFLLTVIIAVYISKTMTSKNTTSGTLTDETSFYQISETKAPPRKVQRKNQPERVQVQSAPQVQAVAVQKPKAENKAVLSTQYQATFVQLSTATLERIYSEGQNVRVGANINYAAFKIKKETKGFILDSESYRALSGARTLKLEKAKEVLFEYIDYENQQEYGMSVRLSTPNVSNKQVSLAVEGFVKIKFDPQTPAETQTFNEHYTFAKGQGFVISGFIPHQKISNAELFTGTPLSLLHDTDFLQNQSELVLLVLPKP